eukprot:CAMPEP_0203704210 /NCGR_PEP_ID=MMETSP0091-20130426/45842_1 /ASSEMBLY_ACC=CAM_ASM_001089 /TAXON_ID=426623 /ORGANISM="Chaetoceros affinis, Strain CCMP159" /LENGTH=42 /DNA_ID= /DNA_START= /DNA_END= /DNA_ORIENTATION=
MRAAVMKNQSVPTHHQCSLSNFSHSPYTCGETIASKVKKTAV